MNHKYYMQLALDLAKKGSPFVAPNPMVGCVIIFKDHVVASGHHQKFGGPHAEVNAINNLPKSIFPSDCSLFITLEPCSHFGKTPPCVDLIIEKGFKKIFIACKDPNPIVSNAITKLINAGIDVSLGLLEMEAKLLNKKYFCFFENNRPYFSLKWAQTADGFISNIPVNKTENKISGHAAQVFTHQLRSNSMAIMVGKNTVLNDNPHLTTRLVSGKNPTRIFIDKNLEVPSNFNIYNNSAPTLIFNSIKDDCVNNISFLKINFSDNILPQISLKLTALNIHSVLVEGGAFLLNEFISQNLYDEIIVFKNPNLYFNTGLKAPKFDLTKPFSLIGEDQFYHLNKTLIP